MGGLLMWGPQQFLSCCPALLVIACADAPRHGHIVATTSCPSWLLLRHCFITCLMQCASFVRSATAFGVATAKAEGTVIQERRYLQPGALVSPTEGRLRPGDGKVKWQTGGWKSSDQQRMRRVEAASCVHRACGWHEGV